MIDQEEFERAADVLRKAVVAHGKRQEAFEAARKDLFSSAIALGHAKDAVRAIVEKAAGQRVWP